jgi:hypothetical protein
MARLASEGRQKRRWPDILTGLPVRSELAMLDHWVRSVFDYRPENEEVVRTPERMWEDLERTGRLEGDCDDIATFIASILVAMGYSTRFVAIRTNPNDPEFSHVYVEAWDGLNWRVFDPTVEPGTVYQSVENMWVWV